MSELGIIIASRLDSKRFPRKVFETIQGKPVLYYLIDRLQKAINIPIIVAVPESEKREYEQMLNFQDMEHIPVFGGDKHNVLKRIADAAHEYEIQNIVRVTHDKIFVDGGLINNFFDMMLSYSLDYIYSNNFIQGTGFEIFTRDVLDHCIEKMGDTPVEHITYVVDLFARRKFNVRSFYNDRAIMKWRFPDSRLNLLIDEITDLDLIKEIIEKFGHHVNIDDIVSRYASREVGRGVDVTIYTCIHNDVDLINQNILSIANQTRKNWEHLICDDGSARMLHNSETIKQYALCNCPEWLSKSLIFGHSKNMGLASSSNRCIARAQGRYVMRLDVDDYLVDEKAIADMVDFMDRTGCDILYPSYYQDKKIMQGDRMHHAGGAMMRRKALEYIRFTDGLKHFDGMDFHQRAMNMRLNIQYYDTPTFHYTQREGSLSKSKSQERQSILSKIKKGILGDRLVDTGAKK